MFRQLRSLSQSLEEIQTREHNLLIAQAEILDIEELASNSEPRAPPKRQRKPRTRKPTVLGVTTFSSQSWCEQQLHLSRFLRPRVRTAAMRKGAERHEAMEAEQHEAVQVEVHSKEDAWALRLMNSVLRIKELKSVEGKCREIVVFGPVLSSWIRSEFPVEDDREEEEIFWISGVIDQVSRVHASELVEISDNKTRVSASLPSLAQSRTTRIQLFLYKFLWDRLSGQDQPSFFKEEFFQVFQLDASRLLSDSVREYSSLTFGDAIPLGNLENVLDMYLRQFSSLGLLSSSELKVFYEHQATGAFIGSQTFDYHQIQLDVDMSYFLKYWKGERKPDAVRYVPYLLLVSLNLVLMAFFSSMSEKWKCSSCQYLKDCEISPVHKAIEEVKEIG